MAEAIKNALKLQAHPMGGFYGESYRDSATLTKCQADVEWLVEKRAASSQVNFLLVGTNVSKLHRLRCDEGITYYAGNTPLVVYFLAADGTLTTKQLDPTKFSYYVNVPKGTWFGVELANKSADSYALYSSTVAPAFEFAEFEVADGEALAKQFPQYAELIKKLT